MNTVEQLRNWANKCTDEGLSERALSLSIAMARHERKIKNTEVNDVKDVSKEIKENGKSGGKA